MKKKDIEKTAKKMPMMQRWKLPPDGSSSAKMKYLCKGAGMRAFKAYEAQGRG